MAENQTLRSLLKGLSAFIGEGAGGLLPKLGWDMTDFTNFVNRSETDTAWESHQLRKKSRTGLSMGSNSQASKRPSEDDFNGPNSKRPRALSNLDGDTERTQDGYSMLINSSAPSVAGNNLHPPTSRQGQDTTIFSDLMRNSGGSSMYLQPSSSSGSPTAFAGIPSSDANGFQNSYLPPINTAVNRQLAPLPFSPSTNGAATSATQVSRPNTSLAEPRTDDDRPKKDDAFKLIQ